MLEERDIKLIEKMISDSITSLKNTIKSTDTPVDNQYPDEQDFMPETPCSHISAYHNFLSKRNGENRKAKVIFALSGGKASKGSQTTRITLPITWVREMGISPEDREVDIRFEDNKIIIEKKKN